jgi:hypothetical protein
LVEIKKYKKDPPPITIFNKPNIVNK